LKSDFYVDLAADILNKQINYRPNPNQCKQTTFTEKRHITTFHICYLPVPYIGIAALDERFAK